MPLQFCSVSSNYFFFCCQWVWEWRSLPSFCHFSNSFQAAGIYFNKVHFNGAWSHNTWGCDLRRAHKLRRVSSGRCMHRRPPRTPCVLLSPCQGRSACQAVPAQEAVSFGMLCLATAKCFRGRYMIPALGELFWTDIKILLDLCGMKLLVCCLLCAGVAGGTGLWLLTQHLGCLLTVVQKVLLQAALLTAPPQTSLNGLKGECTTEVSSLCEGRTWTWTCPCSFPPEAR